MAFNTQSLYLWGFPFLIKACFLGIMIGIIIDTFHGQEIRARRLAKEAKASLAVAENLFNLGLDTWRTFISHKPSSFRVLQLVMRLRQLKVQTTGIRSSMLLMRIFGKKLQGSHESAEGSPANAWLAALQQTKASVGMSRDATRGLLTAIHQGITQQEKMNGGAWAGEVLLRFDIEEAVRLLVSLAHAPEALFGYNSTRW
eukprot:jgi/Astpho2/8786/Aster-05341